MQEHKNAIIEQARKRLVDNRINNYKLAYILATYKHETGNGIWLEEIASGEDYEGRLDLGNTQPGDGVKYKGRGFVQLTGRRNYTFWADYTGLDLVNNPSLASSNIELMASIIVEGMLFGAFTGRQLLDFINENNIDLVGARAVVNGDVAKNGSLIAVYAEEFYQELTAQNNNTSMDKLEYLIAQSGEGWSHLAKRAGYKDWASVERWNYIAGLNGQDIEPRPMLGRSYRVRVNEVVNNQPEPAITPEPVIDARDAQIISLKNELDRVSAQLTSSNLELQRVLASNSIERANLEAELQACHDSKANDGRQASIVLDDFFKSLLSRKFLLSVLSVAGVILTTYKGSLDPEVAGIIGAVITAGYNFANVLEKSTVK